MMVVIARCLNLLVLSLEIHHIIIKRRHFVVVPPSVVSHTLQRIPWFMLPSIVQRGVLEQLSELDLGGFSSPHIIGEMV